MTDEQRKELHDIRERLIAIRTAVLMAMDVNAAVGLSHAIANIHFALTGEELENR